MGAVRADLQAQVHPNYGKGVHFWPRIVGRMLFAPALHAILIYRLSRALAQTPLRPLAFVLRTISVVWAGTEIHPDAEIGPGMFINHSSGIVIAGGVVIGADCRLSQGCSIGQLGRGARDGNLGSPVIGDGVTVGVNAVIIGPCKVGDGAVIGANSVVSKDVPAGAIVGGVPARLIRMADE